MKVNDTPRKRGRPRKSEEEKVATAERRKQGASARREKPSAEMQLKIRAQVLEAAWGKPDLKGTHLATFWKLDADKLGLTVLMLKNICSETTAQKAQAFVEAKQTARPDQRGRGRYWKKFAPRAEGSRLGQFDERGKMKTRQRELFHLWGD